MEINERMITLGRELRGLSQTELSDKIKGLNQGNLSKIEKGLLSASNENIEKIAAFLNLPVSFFTRGDVIIKERELLYRKKLSLSKKPTMQLEARLELIKISLADFLDSIDISDYNIPSIEVRGRVTPEHAAKQVRMDLRLEKGPIKNLINILERNGIIIYEIHDAPGKFDGTFVVTRNGIKVIIVNAESPTDRKRFTIAHELGHIVMHYDFISFDKDMKDIEKEANEFASEFLMPESEIIGDLQRVTYSKLSDLKRYWKVSKSSILYRAKKLKTIDESRYRNLMIEMSRQGERMEERDILPSEHGTITHRLIDLHFEDLGYSKEEILQMLCISEEDFDSHFKNKPVPVKKLKLFI